MRDLFPEYYERTEEEFNELWKDCVFAFDANAILNIFRFSSESRQTYLKILRHFKERLWFPYQAAEEYHRNLPTVIDEQLSKSRNARDASELNKLCNWVGGFKRHPWINFQELSTKIDDIKKILEQSFEDNFKDYHRRCDDLKLEIAELFEGKVGPRPQDMAALVDRAKKRYEQAQPPGYLDLQSKLKVLQDAKTEKEWTLLPGNPYGDALIWFELLSMPVKPKKLVFITDDKKPDWWWIKKSSQTIGPRPELIREMHDAQISFHMYTVDQFMNIASEYVDELDKSEVQEAVKEAQELAIPSPEEPRARLFGRSALLGESTTYPFLWNGKIIYVPKSLANMASLRNTVNRARARLKERDNVILSVSSDPIDREYIASLIKQLVDPSHSPSEDDFRLGEDLADCLADITLISEKNTLGQLSTRPGESCFICEKVFGEHDPVVLNVHNTPFCPDCAPWRPTNR